MIPATVPYRAVYKRTRTDKDGNEHTWFDYEPVIAWDDDGEALIVDEQHGSLVSARKCAGFEGLDPSGHPVVATIPGGGWTVTWIPGADRGVREEFTETVAAWTIDAAGEVKALVTDPETGGLRSVGLAMGAEFNPPTVPEAAAP